MSRGTRHFGRQTLGTVRRGVLCGALACALGAVASPGLALATDSTSTTVDCSPDHATAGVADIVCTATVKRGSGQEPPRPAER